MRWYNGGEEETVKLAESSPKEAVIWVGQHFTNPLVPFLTSDRKSNWHQFLIVPVKLPNPDPSKHVDISFLFKTYFSLTATWHPQMVSNDLNFDTFWFTTLTGCRTNITKHTIKLWVFSTWSDNCPGQNTAVPTQFLPRWAQFLPRDHTTVVAGNTVLESSPKGCDMRANDISQAPWCRLW